MAMPDRSAGPSEAPPQSTARTAGCCPAPGPRDPRIAGHFDRLTRERTTGGVLPPMVEISERLLEQLADVGEARPTVLELGCGSGALAVALARDGAAQVDGVYLSPEALITARRRADQAGVGERTSFVEGDGALLSLTTHDWVVIDRALCCYPDVEALLGNAISAARRRVAFSVPTSRGLRGGVNRFAWGCEAFLTRFQNGPCPGYVHDLDLIEGHLAAAGFTRRSTRSSALWYTAVWERPAAQMIA
jgi:SAM-dependent methyltransferase